MIKQISGIQQACGGVFVDAPVLIHDCFDVQGLIGAAAQNVFRNSSNVLPVAKGNSVQSLTETPGVIKFGEFAKSRGESLLKSASAGVSSQIRRNNDKCCLTAAHPVLGDIRHSFEGYRA